MLVQGAELPPIQRTWLDDDGNPVDLTGHTLSLRIDTKPTPTVKTTGVAGDAQGVVTITWTPGETDNIAQGSYACQVWAKNGSDQDRVMPLTIQILAAIPIS